MEHVRQTLRQATAEDHRRVDSAFSKFDLGHRRSYGAFLCAHARVVPMIEAAVIGLWSGWKPRAPLLLQDLADLALAPPSDMKAALRMEPAGRWGALYVVEGSRLGGSLLSKRVPPGFPSRYLSAGHADGSWQSFQGALEAAAKDEAAWCATAVEAAKGVFRLFEQAAILETERPGD